MENRTSIKKSRRETVSSSQTTFSADDEFPIMEISDSIQSTVDEPYYHSSEIKPDNPAQSARKTRRAKQTQNKQKTSQKSNKRASAKPDMIRCSVCGKLKPVSEFNFLKKKDGKRMNICKECEHDKKKAMREEKKAIMDSLKSVGCACCGEKNPVCLDFHHYDPSEKSFNMSQALLKPYHALIEEASKCIVVCSNCHRRIHAGDINPQDIISRHEYEYRRNLIKTTLGLFGKNGNPKKR